MKTYEAAPVANELEHFYGVAMRPRFGRWPLVSMNNRASESESSAFAWAVQEITMGYVLHVYKRGSKNRTSWPHMNAAIAKFLKQLWPHLLPAERRYLLETLKCDCEVVA